MNCNYQIEKNGKKIQIIVMGLKIIVTTINYTIKEFQ